MIRNFSIQRGRVAYPVNGLIKVIEPGVDVTAVEYAGILDTLLTAGDFPEEIAKSRVVGEDNNVISQAVQAFRERLSECSVDHISGNIEVYFSKYTKILTSDGHIILFKGLRRNYTDAHTGTMDNSPGKIVSLPIESCDTDPDRDCASGLHAAHYDTASGFGPVMVLVVIDPADMVAVPIGYCKVRCKRYRVLEATNQAQGEVDHPALDIASSAKFWSRLDRHTAYPIVVPAAASDVSVMDVVEAVVASCGDLDDLRFKEHDDWYKNAGALRDDREWSDMEDRLILQASVKGLSAAHIADIFLRSEDKVSERIDILVHSACK